MWKIEIEAVVKPTQVRYYRCCIYDFEVYTIVNGEFLVVIDVSLELNVIVERLWTCSNDNGTLHRKVGNNSITREHRNEVYYFSRWSCYWGNLFDVLIWFSVHYEQSRVCDLTLTNIKTKQASCRYICSFHSSLLF